LPDNSEIFGGAATVSSSPAGKLRIVSPDTGESCTFSFGDCATSTPVDTPHKILACDLNSKCSITFSFVSTMTSFTIGKLWSASAFPYLVVRFLNADGDVVLADLISRNGVPCTQGSSFTWSPAKEFNQVVIEGQLTAVTEVSACNNDDCIPYLFTGAGHTTPMSDGTCYSCTDGLGKTVYTSVKCNKKLGADGECRCNTFKYSAPGCNVFFLSSPTPVVRDSFLASVSQLSTVFVVLVLILMKLLFVLLACLFALSLARTEREYQSMFTQWMQKHHKSYHHDEFRYRYGVWKNNLDFIDRTNTQGKSYKVAMNKFGDLTNAEFNQKFKGLKLNLPHTPVRSAPQVARDLPATWNWTDQGVVTGVKDQGQCGSCWAFSTTGSTEGCHALKTSNLVSLSEQNLVDCSGDQGNQGCDGGLMTQAMDYIIDNHGIDTEASYPYKAVDQTCTFHSNTIGATLSSYTNVNQGDESDLQAKVHLGPVSVAIDASQQSFQFYSSGVYNEPDCSTSQLDHGVLAVGWGTDSGDAFWIVKNSWGTSWGLEGYIWMSRNDGNQCGIATAATLPNC